MTIRQKLATGESESRTSMYTRSRIRPRTPSCESLPTIRTSASIQVVDLKICCQQGLLRLERAGLTADFGNLQRGTVLNIVGALADPSGLPIPIIAFARAVVRGLMRRTSQSLDQMPTLSPPVKPLPSSDTSTIGAMRGKPSSELFGATSRKTQSLGHAGDKHPRGANRLATASALAGDFEGEFDEGPCPPVEYCKINHL